jgi:hypothetical protein
VGLVCVTDQDVDRSNQEGSIWQGILHQDQNKNVDLPPRRENDEKILYKDKNESMLFIKTIKIQFRNSKP